MGDTYIGECKKCGTETDLLFGICEDCTFWEDMVFPCCGNEIPAPLGGVAIATCSCGVSPSSR